jgi:hypothetical protein
VTTTGVDLSFFFDCMPLIVFVLTDSVYDYVSELDFECLARFLRLPNSKARSDMPQE